MQPRFASGALSLVLLLLMSVQSSAGLPAAPTAPTPHHVDLHAADVCDDATKRCDDIDLRAFGGTALNGVVLVQAPVPPGYAFPHARSAAALPAFAAGTWPGNHTHDHGNNGNHGAGNNGNHGDGNNGNHNGHGHGGGTGGNGTGNTTTPGPLVPCGDPRGCPDLLVDSTMLLQGGFFTETFAADDCNVVEGSIAQPGTRRVLRFSVGTPNFGDGDLVVGSVFDHLEWFTWSECHGHYHFQQYSDYRLWKPDAFARWLEVRSVDPNATATQVLEAHPELRDGFVAGHKQGFCVIDVEPYSPIAPQKYFDCFYRQGITVGWGDVYGYPLDGQFIDVTDVPPGPYVLEVEVNAERLYQETNYGNNIGAALVVVPPVGANPPPVPDVGWIIETLFS